MALTFGSRPALFKAATQQRPDFAFGSLGGRFILMAFMPRDVAAHHAAMSTLVARGPLFQGVDRIAFSVVQDRELFDHAPLELPWLRHFHDPDGEIAEVFSLTESQRERGCLIVLDPSLRVCSGGSFDQAAMVYGVIARLPPPDQHAGVPMHAPVLIVPRIFEQAFCRLLIDAYHQLGGRPSGVMREIDGKTVGVIDQSKKRSDAYINDPQLQKQIQLRIMYRLIPEIEKAFMFSVTRIERYIVARYDAEEGGYFRAHRDNTTRGTAHRQFACSINLNAQEFEGGDLRFPEFGTRTYRPPTGGAVIFSCSLLHEATRVTCGTRFAFLPFFYDEDHARIREQNLRYVGGKVDNRAADCMDRAT